MFSRGSEGVRGMAGSGGRRRRSENSAAPGAPEIGPNRPLREHLTGRTDSPDAPGGINRPEISVALGPVVELAGDREAQAPAGLLQGPRVGPGMETARAHDSSIRFLAQGAASAVLRLAQWAH